MKFAKKYKKRLKRQIILATICTIFITILLVLYNLTVISMPFKKEISTIIQNVKTNFFASEETNIASANESYLTGIKINEKEYVFEQNVENYNVYLPYDTEDLVKIEYVKANENQTINGENEYIMQKNNKTITFTSISEDKTSTTTYTLNLIREDSNYLKNIELPGYNLNPKFDPEITDYKIYILEGTTKVNIFAVAYDKDSKITISGQNNVSIGSKIEITVTNPHISEAKVYTITCEEFNMINNYSYVGAYQEFIVPITGRYKFECWGGIGGRSRCNGSLGSLFGKGGYAKGEIKVRKGEEYYVYVGKDGTDSVVGKDSDAAWNGGGLGTWDRTDNETSGSGGGATDIRLVSGNWNEIPSLASRIIVAGGAGGSSWSYTPGDGGGLTGTSAYSVSPAGTQTSGYQFGIGRNGWGSADNDGVGGGGGGYWGGQTNNVSKKSSGAGGSGFVSGHEGCIAINGQDDITPKVNEYTQISDSYHYSGKVFTNTELTAGASTNSKASITALELFDTYPIENITVNTGVMSTKFNPAENDYYIELDKEQAYPVVTITPTSDDVIVEDGLVQTIETYPGETIKQIKATGTDGIEHIYNLHFVRKASSDSHLKMIKLNGIEVANYNESILRYEIIMNYNVEDTLIIDGIKKFPNQTVKGLEEIDVTNSTTIHTIEVTSEDGSSTSIYNLVLNRQPNTKLKTIDIKNEDFAKIFESEKTEYEYIVTPGVVSLDITAIPFDDNASVVIKGAGYIKEGKNIVTITVSREGVEDTVYTINVFKGENTGEEVYEFPYTGEYQTFIAPKKGYYKFEAWGAAGGKARLNGSLGGYPGYGGYTAGTIKLNEGDTVYIYVGKKGTDSVVGKDSAGGWNGGGLGTWDRSDNETSGGGGGATDFRLISGDWNDKQGLYSRIMVAGAGGGASWTYKGGAGGGLNGYSHYSCSPAGTQTSGYDLGIGKDGWGAADNDGVAGGGSGYYGGQTNNVSRRSTGSGGSSYISGHEGCKATNENGNSIEDSVNYSGWKFKNTVMIDGEGYEWTDTRQEYVQMQNPQGNYVKGNTSDGYARITLLEDPSHNNLLKEIQINKGTLIPEVNYETSEYTVNVGPEDTELTIYGVVDDIKSTVEGNGTYDILPGENKIELKVTAESGDEKIYTITVNREASSNSKPINITIDGLIESIININPKYGKLDPEEFNPDVHEYSMIVPSRIKKLKFEVEKGHKYQTVTGDGVVQLEAGENKIKIDVTSEDGTSTDTYIYTIIRDMSGNCLLESLTIDNVETDMEFNQDTLEYFVVVENDVTNLDITAIPEMKEITPIIEGNTNLKTGLNDIYIIVTAPNGEQLVYIIHAYRKQSGNVFLDSLKVKNGTEELGLDPTFNKVLDTYIVTVPNDVEKVNIEAIPEANTSKVTGDGEKTLKTGTNTYKIVVTAEDGSKGTYTVNINRALSSNNYLKQLITTAGDIEPEFDKTINEYEVTVPYGTKSLPLVIEAEDKKAKYKVLQNTNLVTGSNIVIIRVTAENGEQRDYKIKVNVEPSDNNYLRNIITNHGTLDPEFDKDTLKYTVEVENEVENINIKAVKDDISSKVTGEGTYALQIGDNTVTLSVEAENGDIKNYELNIVRKLSGNTNLLRIDNDKQQIVTKVNDNTYEINVRNEISNITITGIPEKATSKVNGNGKYELEIGKNIIKLEVTSEIGTTKQYDVIINRLKSDNAYLKSLFADEGQLSEVFNKEKQNYNMKVQENVQNLTLEVETEDEEATYEIIGNENFVYGENKVIVRVTASDGITKRDYTINVYRQPDLEERCDLLELTVNKGVLTPEFDANTLVYEVNLPYEEDTINVSATSLDNTATITGTGNYNLKVGANVANVKVTSTAGEEKSYQIKINRAPSTNANLAKLNIQNHAILPEFDSLVTEYTLQTSLSELVINPTPQEEGATYEIIGNEDLQKGTNLVTIRVTAPDKKTTKDYVLKINKTGSDNNNLAFLDVVGYDLNPTFNKSTLLYTVNVPNSVKTVYVDAVADDINATISGIGIVNLQDGKNNVQVNVTSESGKTKTYTIIINKGFSDNAYLSKLESSEGTLVPEFDKLENNYEIIVNYEIENISFSGYPEDSNATVDGMKIYNLEVGENAIPITVTAPSGAQNTYNVTVKRKSAVSAKLSKLEVKDYTLTPMFNGNVNSYFVSVNNETTSLDMIIETLDPNATYVVKGNSNFVVGNNTVEIEVTSSDGVTKETYTIQVNRQVSSNNYLSYILPSEGTLSPAFNKLTNNYTVVVGNDITNINIDADTEDSNSTLTGIGDYELAVGENKVVIEVTSAIGVKRTYTVNVIREKNSNNYLKSLSPKIGSDITEIKPIFNKETLKYEITVPVGTTRIQFLGEPEESLSTVEGLGYVSLKTGINTHKIKVKAENGDIRTYEITINRPASSVNDLIDLIPSVGTLSPSFTYGKLEYDLTLGNKDSLLSFEVNTQDRFATVAGEEEQEVPDGLSTREIVVTAEDGTTKTYIIHVNRIRTDDARLASLAVKSYQLEEEFNSDKYEYNLIVPNDKFVLTENEIVAKPIYETTKVYPDIEVELSVLKVNTYKIKTIAEDGYTTQTYTINVVRQKSSDSSLSRLAVSGYVIEPEFESKTLEYKITVPKDTTIIKASDVIAIPTDEYATVVKSEDLDLTAGRRTFNIDVTSHDGTTNTNYKIKVEKAKSENNYLKSLTTNVGTLTPEFDTNIVEYKLHLTQRQDELIINAIPEDPYAKVISGNGKHQITSEGKRILVMVQAENETLRAYIIDVTKDEKTETKIKGKIITENIYGKHKANIEVYDKEGNLVKQTNTNEDGSYEVYVELGIYDVIVKKEGYLEYRVNNIIIENLEQEVELEDYNLIAGDVVKTGEIEIDDLTRLGNNYGTVTEENKEKKEKYDLNGDTKINSIDRNILKKNYGKKAETKEWENPLPAALLAKTKTKTKGEGKEGEEDEEEETEEVTEGSAPYSLKRTEQNLVMPLKTEYTITSPYGYRKHPTTGEYKKHTGIDLVGSHHGEIVAIANGEVTYSGVNTAFGNCIEIKHTYKGEIIYSFYAHLSRRDVELGDKVVQGQIIGLEGGASTDDNPGWSTGHHLHFEIRKASGYGNDVDPNDYFDF